MKVRMVRRYSPYSGSWYVLQFRLFLFWWTLPKVYTDSVTAEQAMRELRVMFDNRIDNTVVAEKEIEI